MGVFELYYGIPSILKEAEKIDKTFRGTYLAVIFWETYMLMGLGISISALLTVAYNKPLYLQYIYANQPHTFDTTLYVSVYEPWVDVALYSLIVILIPNIFTHFNRLSGGCDIP